MTERVLILDFGSQVTQLIARRVRESGVYCEILPYSIGEERLRQFAPAAIILSGGPASVHERAAPLAPPLVYELGVPVLGICYGQQAMCAQLGGRVAASEQREFGRAFIDVTGECALFEGLWPKGAREQVWMSHGDRVEALPPGFRAVAVSEGAPFAVVADDQRRFYGTMFHPEVIHTPQGAALLKNFTHRVAGCRGDWTMAAFRAQEVERIKAKVGEGEEVVALFRDHYNIPLVHRDASRLFLEKLAGVEEPEEKRKIIGATFIDVFDEEAQKAGGAEFLAQGTLYPDVIESVSVAGGPSVTIKSHHNVGGLPERMKLRLVEPLRELFKDEVRALGRELGLPERMVKRHPFPGPGLAILMPGAVTAEKLAILRKADAIFLEEIRNAG